MKRLSSFVLPSLLLLVGAPPLGAEILERVVAKVNGDIVTLSDFEARQVMAIQAAGVASDKIEAYLRENNAKILQEAVDDLLIAQRADDLEIHLPPEAVKGAIENIKKDNHLATDEDLRAQLRREGMTFEDLKRNITQTFLKRAVLQRELERKVAPGEDEILAYYQGHKDEFTGPATVHLQQIFIPAAGSAPGADDPESARVRAAEVVNRARGGEDFGALAEAYSVGGGKGDLGVVNQKEISPAIQKAIAPLQVGEVSEPVSSPDGFRVFKLLARTEARVAPLEEVRNKIHNRLMDAKGNDAYEKYVADLRKNAIIDIRVREVPLQVSRPVGPTTLLEPPPEDSSATSAPAAPTGASSSAGPPEPSSGADDELQTTPQAAPEHVAPAAPPGAEEKDKKDAAPPQ
jgi:peptidyl-prolyl cis-trans isomerase SurA